MAQTLLLSCAFVLTLSLVSAWNFPPNLYNLRKHRITRRDTDINFIQILNFWKEHKDELIYPRESKQVVLMMGNTNVGKNKLISYNLIQDETKKWINSNLVYSMIRSRKPFLSPYVMWNIRLEAIGQSVSWNHMSIFANETIDLELIGHGYYIMQDPEFNIEVCNEYLDTIYNDDDIVKELV